MKIEFREIDSLNKVASSYYVRQCRPGRICTSSLSSSLSSSSASSISSSSSKNMLLFVDHKKHPREAKWLDCGKSPPEPAEDAGSIHVQHAIVWDLCCTENAKQRLLITTGGFDGINAHNTGTDKLEWSVKGELSGVEDEITAEGVTSDGRGHLFVSDENNKCVHVFSTSGDHVGIVLREGEQGLGRPRLIHWCESSSNLIVAHIIDEQYCISQIEVEQDVVTTSGKKTNQDAAGNDSAAEEDNGDTETVTVTRRQTRSLTRSTSKNAKTKSKGRRGRKKNVDPAVDKARQSDKIVPEKAHQNEEVGAVDQTCQLDETTPETANQSDEIGAVDKPEVPLNVSATDEDLDLFFESLAEDPPPTKAQQTTTEQGDSGERLHDDQRRRTRSQKQQASTRSDRDAQDVSGRSERRRKKSAESRTPTKARRGRAESEPHDVLVIESPARDQSSSDHKTSKSKRRGMNCLFIIVQRIHANEQKLF